MAKQLLLLLILSFTSHQVLSTERERFEAMDSEVQKLRESIAQIQRNYESAKALSVDELKTRGEMLQSFQSSRKQFDEAINNIEKISPSIQDPKKREELKKLVEQSKTFVESLDRVLQPEVGDPCKMNPALPVCSAEVGDPCEINPDLPVCSK